MTRTPLIPGKYYHIYNHANGWDDLYTERSNYLFFIHKLKNLILPVSHIHGYCLMPNHFHFLVKCKSESELFDFIMDDPKSRRFLKFDVPEIHFQIELFEEKKARPKRVEVSADYSELLTWQFARLFNSYTKAMNKKYNRYGSLFNHSFKRKPIPEKDLQRVLNYIHNNPVNHGFSIYPDEWEFSSIHIYQSKEESWVERLEF